MSYEIACRESLTTPALVDVEIDRTMRRKVNTRNEATLFRIEQRIVFLYRLRNEVCTPVLPMFPSPAVQQQPAALTITKKSSDGTTERSPANENLSVITARRSQSVGVNPAHVSP
jgi:hypothetical protein